MTAACCHQRGRRFRPLRGPVCGDMGGMPSWFLPLPCNSRPHYVHVHGARYHLQSYPCARREWLGQPCRTPDHGTYFLWDPRAAPTFLHYPSTLRHSATCCTYVRRSVAPWTWTVHIRSGYSILLLAVGLFSGQWVCSWFLVFSTSPSIANASMHIIWKSSPASAPAEFCRGQYPLLPSFFPH